MSFSRRKKLIDFCFLFFVWFFRFFVYFHKQTTTPINIFFFVLCFMLCFICWIFELLWIGPDQSRPTCTFGVERRRANWSAWCLDAQCLEPIDAAKSSREQHREPIVIDGKATIGAARRAKEKSETRERQHHQNGGKRFAFKHALKERTTSGAPTWCSNKTASSVACMSSLTSMQREPSITPPSSSTVFGW